MVRFFIDRTMGGSCISIFVTLATIWLQARNVSCTKSQQPRFKLRHLTKRQSTNQNHSVVGNDLPVKARRKLLDELNLIIPIAPKATPVPHDPNVNDTFDSQVPPSQAPLLVLPTTPPSGFYSPSPAPPSASPSKDSTNTTPATNATDNSSNNSTNTTSSSTSSSFSYRDGLDHLRLAGVFLLVLTLDAYIVLLYLAYQRRLRRLKRHCQTITTTEGSGNTTASSNPDTPVMSPLLAQGECNKSPSTITNNVADKKDYHPTTRGSTTTSPPNYPHTLTKDDEENPVRFTDPKTDRPTTIDTPTSASQRSHRPASSPRSTSSLIWFT